MKKTIYTADELNTCVKLLVALYSHYVSKISEELKLTYKVTYSELEEEYKVTFSWICDQKLIHLDPESSYAEYEGIPAFDYCYFHDTEPLIKLHERVNDCLEKVAETRLYSISA